MRKKILIKDTWKEQHCKSCLWLTKEGLCPFLMCVKVKGWVADKNASEGEREGENNE